MKTIFINGNEFNKSSTELTNLAQALVLFFDHQPQSTFAVALNGDFIGKEDYQTTAISTGDSIDILFPIQGG